MTRINKAVFINYHLLDKKNLYYMPDAMAIIFHHLDENVNMRLTSAYFNYMSADFIDKLFGIGLEVPG